MGHAEHRAVAGVDGVGSRWVVALLSDDGDVRWQVVDGRDLGGLLDVADVVGVDVPVGLAEHGLRPADLAARTHLAGSASSVFLTHPAPAVRVALDRPWAPALRVAAQELSRAAGSTGISAQSWALVPKILEVERVLLDALRRDPAVLDRLVEVHPECSYREMAGTRLPRKRSAAGVGARLRLLAEHLGVGPQVLEADELAAVPVDDALDALAVAWSARRWRDRRTSGARELGRADAVAAADPAARLVSRVVV